MDDKMKRVLSLVGLTAAFSIALGTVGVLAQSGELGHLFISRAITSSEYEVAFTSANAINDNVAEATTSGGNTFKVVLSNYEAAANKFVQLNQNGTIKCYGDTYVKGLKGITVTFTGNLKVGFGYTDDNPIADRVLESGVRLQVAATSGAKYFKIVADEATTIDEITLVYGCFDVDTTVSGLYVDPSLSKKAYMKGDTPVSSDFAVYAVFGQDGKQRLEPSDYSVDLDTSTVGSKTATFTYLENSSITTTTSITVGEYDVTSADINLVNEKAIVTISGTYSNFTSDEFLSFGWNCDFQKHGTLNGDESDWTQIKYEPVFNVQDGVWSYDYDVTDFDTAYYFSHINHKVHEVPGDDDLKINAQNDKAKRILTDNKDYFIAYNLGHTESEYCWGTLGLRITNHHYEYNIIGDFSSWAWSDMYTSSDGYYTCKDLNTTDTGTINFKIRCGGWETNLEWGYDQIDWNSCPYGCVYRGKSENNQDNNIFLAKGTYTVKFDLWFDKVIISGDPSYSLIGAVNGTNWDNDMVLTRSIDEAFVIKNVTFASGNFFKLRTGGNWDFAQFNSDSLLGNYSSVLSADDGKNIHVQDAGIGKWNLVLNSKTGKVTAIKMKNSDNSDTVYSLIGVGGDWYNDVDMVYDPTEEAFVKTVTLTNANEQNRFKIRVGHAWGYEFNFSNLGDYPTDCFNRELGKDHDTDICCTQSGTYKVSFSTITGKINIEKVN